VCYVAFIFFSIDGCSCVVAAADLHIFALTVPVLEKWYGTDITIQCQRLSMISASDAGAGDCQHHSSMLKDASSRHVPSVSRGHHYTGRRISASTAGRSISADRAAAQPSASMIYIALDVRRASLWAA
jgi:hypothetical protein